MERIHESVSETKNQMNKTKTYVRAQQPRISPRCLWSLNQYGRIPNTNKNTARPNSITADMTLTAYQTSPAFSVTRPWRGKLETEDTKRTPQSQQKVPYIFRAESPSLRSASAVKPRPICQWKRSQKNTDMMYLAGQQQQKHR